MNALEKKEKLKSLYNQWCVLCNDNKASLQKSTPCVIFTYFINDDNGSALIDVSDYCVLYINKERFNLSKKTGLKFIEYWEGLYKMAYKKPVIHNDLRMVEL